MQSARVKGNPWVLYSEERYQKFLAFLEEVLALKIIPIFGDPYL